MSEADAHIRELTAAGRFEDAAAYAESTGDHLRAAELYAEVWAWPRAMVAAERAARHDLVYSYAIAAKDRTAIARALEALLGHGDLARAAAAVAADKGRVADAGRLLESAGDLSQAAAHYVDAGEYFDAARCHEAQGGYREAGKLYEKRLKDEPDDAEAAVRLGRILASFGRYDHAAKALQRGEQSPVAEPAQRARALTLMVACFAARGLDEAASRCLERLRALDPSRTLPITVGDFLEETYGDRGGLAALAREGDQGQLIAGRYRILRALGVGATGRVFLAHDGFYDRQVAVKVLTVGGGASGRDAYERFAREARVAAGIDHPNVVSVFEFNPDGPFLVMEFMEGGTLLDRLQGVAGSAAGGRLALPVVRHVLSGVLGALSAVHGRGVTHRDLKPANVFFGPTGDVKLGDFGVAHLTDLGATLTGAMMGTLAYMSPEQITGSTKPTAATDLYALGVLAHRMLTGRLPFPGPDFVTQHLNDAPPRVGEVAPVLGDVFDALVLGLLAKDAGDRPASADEVRERLDALSWVDPEDDAIIAATAPLATSRPGEQAGAEGAPQAGAQDDRTEPPADHRYEVTGADGALKDLLLDRPVTRLELDPAAIEQLRRFARADSPFLQAVYELDEDGGTAIVEAPLGKPLDGPLTDLQRSQLAQALQRLHAEGVVHGELRSDRILVGPHRTVLLLPTTTSLSDRAERAPERDRDALAAL